MLQFFNPIAIGFINSEKTIRKSEINHITRKQFKRLSVITLFFIIIG